MRKLFKKVEFQIFLLVVSLVLVFWFTGTYMTPINSLTIELIRATYTIAVFYLGQRFGRQREEEKSQKEKKDLREYVYTILGFMERPYLDQVENMKTLIQQMRTVDQLDFVTPVTTSFNFKNIKQQNDTTLFSAFVFNLKGDSYEKPKSFAVFKTSVEYFDRVMDQTFLDLSKSFSDKLSTLHQEFNQYAKPIQEQFQGYLMEITEKKMSDDVSNKFIKIANANRMESLKHGGPKYAGFFDTHIIKPLLQVCNGNMEDQRCLDMLIDLSNCKVTYENIEQHRKLYSGLLEQLVNDMVEQKEKLDTAISYFKYIDR